MSFTLLNAASWDISKFVPAAFIVAIITQSLASGQKLLYCRTSDKDSSIISIVRFIIPVVDKLSISGILFVNSSLGNLLK